MMSSLFFHALLIATICHFYSPPHSNTYLLTYLLQPVIANQIYQPMIKSWNPRTNPHKEKIPLKVIPQKLFNSPPQQQQLHPVHTAEQATTKETDALLKLLHTAIAAQQFYPESAQALHQTGRVKVGFVLHPTGQIEQIALLQSSGMVSLDEAALDAVSAASPVKEVGKYLVNKRFLSVDIFYIE